MFSGMAGSMTESHASASILNYRICYSRYVDERDIYQTGEVAAWLQELQDSDPKTADLVMTPSTR